MLKNIFVETCNDVHECELVLVWVYTHIHGDICSDMHECELVPVWVCICVCVCVHTSLEISAAMSMWICACVSEYIYTRIQKYKCTCYVRVSRSVIHVHILYAYAFRKYMLSNTWTRVYLNLYIYQCLYLHLSFHLPIQLCTYMLKICLSLTRYVYTSYYTIFQNGDHHTCSLDIFSTMNRQTQSRLCEFSPVLAMHSNHPALAYFHSLVSRNSAAACESCEN